MLYDGMGDAGKSCRGKLIRAIEINEEDNKLRIKFDHGTLVLWDDQQSCCEHRYMRCEDPFQHWVGQPFVGYRVESGPTEHGNYGDEIQSEFLIVDTFLGSFTVVNYNSHNGYYGGFGVKAELKPRDGWEELKTYVRSTLDDGEA